MCTIDGCERTLDPDVHPKLCPAHFALRPDLRKA